jgi:hypothetical protein
MGASLSEASRPMEAAQRAIQGGIGGLQTLVADQQQIAQAGVDRGNEANVQKFLDRLQGARTPEEVLALQQTGELDTLRSALTPKDLARVRGAEETRAASLMQQLTAKSTFETQQAAAKAAPIKDQIMSMYMTGDPAQQARAKELFAANPNIPGGAELVKSMNAFDQDKATRDFQAKLNPLKLQEAELSIENNKSSAAYQEEQRKLLADQRAAQATQNRLQAEAQFLRETGNVYADGVFNPNDTQALHEMMVKAGIGDDPGERQAVIERLSKIANQELEYRDADGKIRKQSIPVPMSLARQAILGSKDQMFNLWNQGYANTMEKNLRASMRAGLENKDAPKNQVVKDFEAYMLNRMGVVAAPPVTGSGKKTK